MSTETLFQDLFGLSGRVAFVTGASKGLGRAMAQAFAEAGADVALCSRSGSDAQQAATEIARSTGRRVVGLEADVSCAEGVHGFINEAQAELGPPDILVANAGINIRKPTGELTEADWDAVLNTNLKGAFLAAQAVLGGMRERGWGRIIFLGSMLSFISVPGRAAYASSKAALLGLTRTLALETAREGVRVNAICPGPFATPMNRVLIEDKERTRIFLEKVPVGRYGKPEELRGLALLLAGEAASFITGSAFVVDGGWTAQ